MKQRIERLSTQNNRSSTVTRRYFSAGFSTLLQTGAVMSLILIGAIAFTGATNLFGLNGSAYAEYTISMTSSGAQSIDILPGASNVNTSISVDAVTVTTTCPAGYNLTTTTSVNDNKLYLNGSSSNNATGTYFNPSDGTTALSNAPNTWGFYQDGSTVPTASSVFKPVPINTSTPATIRTSSSTSDSFNIYYGVAASSSLAAGTYKMIPEQNTNENGTIVYYLTMAEECTQYTIHFNPTSTAGGTSVSGTGFMADQFATPGSLVQLNTNSFVAPSGYIFDSWNTAQDGSGIAYQDNDLAHFSAGSGDTITLFAQWKRTGLSLQGATYEDCGKTMYDNRSNNSYKDILYTTAKINSLCWMTRNLDLPGSTTITAKDSNVTNNYTLPNSSKSGFSTNTAQYVYNSGSVDCSSSSGCYSYYSFRTALAGNNSTSTSAPSNYDICPNGWRLPNRDDFQALRSSYPSAASLIANPFASVNAGYYYNSTFSGGNTTAYYWASAGYGTNNGCSLFYTSTTGNVSVDGKAKAGGYALRCVKDNTPSYNISFIYDNNVSSVRILDSSGSIVGTITSSGQSLPLEQYKTYTVKPIHTAGYNNISITKTSGVGTISGKQFTVGAGAATLSVTSKPLSPIQNFNCSSLASGSTEEVYDTRDNEVYLIGKLADGKCWMLDNLRLDLTNSTILNGLTTTNTHVDSASLTSLKSGNRSAGKQYASSGFVAWAQGDESAIFNQAKANADYKDTTTTSYGDGSGKIGVYYNYCAASAGSYCYDSGAGTGNAQYDLCPAGWRMPTGSSSGEYQALYTAYSSNATSFRNALSTPLSGYFYSGSAHNKGNYGYFWSSTYGNDGLMYNLRVLYDRVYPAEYDTRSYGFPLRCLLGS